MPRVPIDGDSEYAKSGKGAEYVSHTVHSTLSSIRNQGREAAFPKSSLFNVNTRGNAPVELFLFELSGAKGIVALS